MPEEIVDHLPSPALAAADFAHLDRRATAEISPLLERAAEQGDPSVLAALTLLLLDRSLRALREGSRQELLDEALLVSRGVSGALGTRLRAQSPETFGAWYFLQDLLAEAGQRSDRASVPTLLRGTEGHGQAILELLAAEVQPVPRSRIRKELGLGEAHLSHLLRDLGEANLLRRLKPTGSREVLVELSTVGRELKESLLLPRWMEEAIRALRASRAGQEIDADDLARSLQTAGAPSGLLARRLAEALAEPAEAPFSAPGASRAAASPAPPDNVLPFDVRRRRSAFREETAALAGDDRHFQRVSEAQPGDTPVSAFGLSVPAAPPPPAPRSQAG